MLYRDNKLFLATSVHHIINRGNDKKIIFHDAEDYEFFLMRLYQNLSLIPIKQNKKSYTIKSLPAGSFDLLSFCLMPNHFHLLLRQNSNISVSAFMLKLCTSYSKYFNKRHIRSGSLFQDQFKAIPISTNKQLQTIILYINNNPVKAKLVKDARDYPYCSVGSKIPGGTALQLLEGVPA